MKKLFIMIVTTLSVMLPVSALAATKLPASYQAVYCYPTGTYWQKQIKAYPDYYATYGSFYAANYGKGTIYCP